MNLKKNGRGDDLRISIEQELHDENSIRSENV